MIVCGGIKHPLYRIPHDEVKNHCLCTLLITALYFCATRSPACRVVVAVRNPFKLKVRIPVLTSPAVGA